MIKAFTKCMQIYSKETIVFGLLDLLVGVCVTPDMSRGGARVGGATVEVSTHGSMAGT